jgi:hypothetical protein
VLSPSVFIGKNRGGREVGAATMLPSHDCPRRHVSSVSLTRVKEPRVSLASGYFGSASF